MYLERARKFINEHKVGCGIAFSIVGVIVINRLINSISGGAAGASLFGALLGIVRALLSIVGYKSMSYDSYKHNGIVYDSAHTEIMISSDERYEQMLEAMANAQNNEEASVSEDAEDVSEAFEEEVVYEEETTEVPAEELE